MSEQRLGIDIGGSGIKGALVDVAAGEMRTERYRIDTPQPSTPAAVAKVVAEIVAHYQYRGPIGVTFPAVVKNGVTLSAANVDKGWIGTDAQALFAEATQCPVTVLNDADAAGIAEARFGAAKGQRGVVLLLTFGTGVGSALFIDGILVPNTEFGHMHIDGKEVEERASDRIRQEQDLSWNKFGRRVNRVLEHFEMLFTPDLFVIGGGVSAQLPKFRDQITVKTPFVPAALLNNAGIVGAAVLAHEIYSKT